MHGRLKIRTDAEKAEAERKKNEEKASKFRAGMQTVFAMRSKGIKDDSVLDLTAKLLVVNPDVYTLWNYRREVLLCRKPNLEAQTLKVEGTTEQVDCQETDNSGVDPKKVFDSLCENELDLVISCLPRNPKSYPCWHHRTWVLENMFNPNLAQELSLIEDALNKDSRNFHTWDHRLWLTSFAHIPVGNELVFTETKITDNFSNFSAWFVRSCLLTEAHDSGLLDMKRLWDEEYSRVENAIFTDPTDQSAWFYHKWLTSIDLGNNMRMTGVENIPSGDRMQVTQLSLAPNLLTVRFSRATASLPPLEVNVDGIGFNLKGNLLTDTDNPFLQSIWSFKGSFAGKTLVIKFLKHKSVEVKSEEKTIIILTAKNFQEYQDFTSERKLKEENLNNLKQLLEMEPDNKWINLTMSYFDEDRLSVLDKLSELDPLRRGYFQDQKSRLILDKELKRLEGDTYPSSLLSLPSLHLTRLYSPHKLIHVRHLDLSGNNFCQMTRVFNDLVNLEVLILDNNHVNFIEKHIQVISLKVLSLQKNVIHDQQELRKLNKCLNLEKVLVFGNPFLTKSEDVVKDVKQYCPSICVENYNSLLFLDDKSYTPLKVINKKLHI